MSRHQASDPLLKWTEQLADGKALDLNDLEGLDPALLAGLQQIEALAQGFGSLVVDLNAVDDSGPLASGSLFGSLQIVNVLGRGGFGTVYSAHDAQLDRVVALKIPADSNRQRAELLREGQLMARIDHPHVLKVHGVIEHQGQIGFACELMSGESMEAWASRQGSLNARELIAIGSELCAALSALHREGVLHGDLKPANVLRHESGRWVVADFGSGQFTWSESGSSGTPVYMAPERLQSTQMSPASDQYSLGVLLFRLASGQYPVQADNIDQLLAALQSDQRLRLFDLRPDLPAALIAAIERALEMDPARRHGSIGALANALAQASPDQSNLLEAAARPASPGSRRRLVWLAISSVLLLGLLSLALFTGNGWRAAGERVRWVRGGDSAQVLTSGTVSRPGESLALELNLDRTRFVYVINEDSHGERFQLFPLAESDLQNPLPAGHTRLPGAVAGATLDWSVTSRGGRERFYVLIADRALSELAAGDWLQASLQRSASSGEVAALQPERGVGGLTSRQPTETGGEAAWLNELHAKYPGLAVERFELLNP